MEAIHHIRHGDAHVVGVQCVPYRNETVDAHTDACRTTHDRGHLDALSHWLERAARLPGKSMQAAVVLQLIAAAQETHRVVLGNLACQRFGLNRNAKYRALRSLENAGLVDVERKLGRSPVVTILDGAGAL